MYYKELFYTKHHRKCGNHRAEVEYGYDHRKYCICFYYFETLICIAYLQSKTFILTDGGWNTISTHRAIMNYKKFLESKHFQLSAINLCGFYGLPSNLIRKEKDHNLRYQKR